MTSSLSWTPSPLLDLTHRFVAIEMLLNSPQTYERNVKVALDGLPHWEGNEIVLEGGGTGLLLLHSFPSERFHRLCRTPF
jgi:hypothetical protein